MLISFTKSQDSFFLGVFLQWRPKKKPIRSITSIENTCTKTMQLVFSLIIYVRYSGFECDKNVTYMNSKEIYFTYLVLEATRSSSSWLLGPKKSRWRLLNHRMRGLPEGRRPCGMPYTIIILWTVWEMLYFM